MIRGILPRLKSTANAVSCFVLETRIARLATMAAKLWPRVRLLSLLLALLVIACIVLAGLSARSVFTTLSPASPSGIGAGIAAGITALAVLALCAFATSAGIETALRLAHDVGRHRVGVLLALATTVAALLSIASVPATEPPTTEGWIVLAITALLLAMTGWFQRTYRRPARRGFRDFHVDVVDARHFLARAVHGA
ncbi:MAG TPA: hypothetical protein VIU82_18890 [Bosea sp. (in: a-proteobacteria)]